VPPGDKAIDRASSTSAKMLIEKPFGSFIDSKGSLALASVIAGKELSTAFDTTELLVDVLLQHNATIKRLDSRTDFWKFIISILKAQITK
jgi:glucose-6-phosphate 1-dehydrogenase